jgi:hypothetical protein
MATSAEAALGRGALIFFGLGMLNQLAEMSGLKRGEFHGAAFAELARSSCWEERRHPFPVERSSALADGAERQGCGGNVGSAQEGDSPLVANNRRIIGSL